MFMSLNFVSIGGTTKFKFCGPEDVVPHNFTQFFHTNFCGTTFMFLLRSGIITLFQLFHTLSLSLSLQSKCFLAFVFYNISALSYLPRARTSAPRRFQGTLLYCFTLQCSRRSRFVRPTQSSGVTSHYSVGSRARCPCPALQTPYIYTTSYY